MTIVLRVLDTSGIDLKLIQPPRRTHRPQRQQRCLHRITLRPELWVRQVSSDDVVARLLAGVPTPRTDPRTAHGTGPGSARATVQQVTG